MDERHVAFHGLVTLISWTDSSSQGPKVRFALADRGALTHFDTATRRRGKRAGQRYQAAMTTDEENPVAVMELWFAGANWSHQDGAKVAFTVTQEDLEFFRPRPTADQKEKPFEFRLTLVELGDDDAPVDQAKAEVVEEQEERKGGPLSKNAARLCHDDEFQWYVSEKEGLDDKATFAQADAYIKRVVGIESKVEFDYNHPAWARLECLVKAPFLRWSGA